METNKFRYARRCSFTHNPMNEGYCFNDGNFYACDELAAKKYVESLGANWKDELKTFNTTNEWFYWTQWEEIDDDCFYDVNGREWTLEEARSELLEEATTLIAGMKQNDTRLWEDTLECKADCVVMEKCSLEMDEYIDPDPVKSKNYDMHVVTAEFINLYQPLNRLEHLTNLLK